MLPKIKILLIVSSLILSLFLVFSHDTRLLGQLSLILLSIVIFTKPAVRLFPTVSLFKYLLILRRQTGQMSAIFVIAHVLAQVTARLNIFSLLSLDYLAGPGSYLFWGFWGFVLILPLFITSNDLSTRLLKRNWFLLQKLVHPVYIFSMMHYALFKSPTKQILVIFVLILLYASRFLAGRGVTFFAPKLVPPK